MHECESHSVVSNSLQPYGLYSLWNSPGQNSGVGSLSLLQGIFWTQGWNPGLPHCRWVLYQLSFKGSPRILEWVAYPFSKGTSQPRNWTGVPCIAGGLFTNWAAISGKAKKLCPLLCRNFLVWCSITCLFLLLLLVLLASHLWSHFQGQCREAFPLCFLSIHCQLF